MDMAKSRKQEKGAAAYGREALSEWGNAVRYGGHAIAARLQAQKEASDRVPLRERLDPSKTEKGGRFGDAADSALARFGTPGKLASKASLGSRLVDRLGGGAGNGGGPQDAPSAEDASSDSAVPFPIQESIDVAIPISGAFELGSQFLDFPKYLKRAAEVEEADETHFIFAARIGRRLREMEVEIVDERPENWIEWECVGDVEHSGVLTFHPLAPRLTRLELTIEREPEGVSERLARRAHLPDRAIQEELHRFKAHAELLDDDFEDYVPESLIEDEGSLDEEVQPEEEDEEPEEPLEEPEEPLDEAEELDEEQVEEDELEPA